MQLPNSGMPIFLENSPQTICDQVLWLIKNSQLNFQARETPYSLSLSIKKRFAQRWDQSQFSPTPVSAQISPEPIHETDKLKPHDFEQQREALTEIINNMKEVQDNLETCLLMNKQERSCQLKKENFRENMRRFVVPINRPKMTLRTCLKKGERFQ